MNYCMIHVTYLIRYTHDSYYTDDRVREADKKSETHDCLSLSRAIHLATAVSLYNESAILMAIFSAGRAPFS